MIPAIVALLSEHRGVSATHPSTTEGEGTFSTLLRAASASVSDPSNDGGQNHPIANNLGNLDRSSPEEEPETPIEGHISSERGQSGSTESRLLGVTIPSDQRTHPTDRSDDTPPVTLPGVHAEHVRVESQQDTRVVGSSPLGEGSEHGRDDDGLTSAAAAEPSPRIAVEQSHENDPVRRANAVESGDENTVRPDGPRIVRAPHDGRAVERDQPLVRAEASRVIGVQVELRPESASGLHALTRQAAAARDTSSPGTPLSERISTVANVSHSTVAVNSSVGHQHVVPGSSAMTPDARLQGGSEAESQGGVGSGGEAGSVGVGVGGGAPTDRSAAHNARAERRSLQMTDGFDASYRTFDDTNVINGVTVDRNAGASLRTDSHLERTSAATLNDAAAGPVNIAPAPQQQRTSHSLTLEATETESDAPTGPSSVRRHASEDEGRGTARSAPTLIVNGTQTGSSDIVFHDASSNVVPLLSHAVRTYEQSTVSSASGVSVGAPGENHRDDLVWQRLAQQIQITTIRDASRLTELGLGSTLDSGEATFGDAAPSGNGLAVEHAPVVHSPAPVMPHDKVSPQLDWARGGLPAGNQQTLDGHATLHTRFATAGDQSSSVDAISYTRGVLDNHPSLATSASPEASLGSRNPTQLELPTGHELQPSAQHSDGSARDRARREPGERRGTRAPVFPTESNDTSKVTEPAVDLVQKPRGDRAAVASETTPPPAPADTPQLPKPTAIASRPSAQANGPVLPTPTTGESRLPSRTDSASIRIEDADGRSTYVRVTVRGDQVRTHIVHPDRQTAGQLAAGSEQLREALNARGFHEATVNVHQAKSTIDGTSTPNTNDQSHGESRDSRWSERDDRQDRRHDSRDARQDRQPFDRRDRSHRDREK